jgi:hypothetical protein
MVLVDQLGCTCLAFSVCMHGVFILSLVCGVDPKLLDLLLCIDCC